MRDELRNLPAPEPSLELWGRILRSRARAVRIPLPVGYRFTRAVWVATAIVACATILTLAFSLGRAPKPAPAGIAQLLGGTMLMPSAGVAQETKGSAPEPRYPLVLSESLNVSRLSPGVWTYRYETVTDGVFTDSSGGDRFRLTRATYEGRPAWMLNTASHFRSQAWSQYGDTTYLDAASLRPLHAAASTNRGRTRLEQTFSQDSARESVDRTGPMPRSWRGGIALPFGRNALFFNDWSPHRLSVIAPVLPITRDWRGSVYQVAFVSWHWPRSAAPLDLRVVGTESVTVPAGTFDCWRIDVAMHLWADESLTLWVSRDKGWVIKQQTRASDFVINRVLETYEPGN